MKPTHLLILAALIVLAATALAFIGPNDELTAAIAGGLVVSLRDVIGRAKE